MLTITHLKKPIRHKDFKDPIVAVYGTDEFIVAVGLLPNNHPKCIYWVFGDLVVRRLIDQVTEKGA